MTTELLISPEEYIAQERVALERHEYFDGELYQMAGASFIHNRLASRLMRLLYGTLDLSRFDVMCNDLRVHSSLDNSYVYPDVVIVGIHNVQFADDNQDILLNPLVIFEILSPGTEAMDRGKKLDTYTSLPSLQEYILVAQQQPCLERYQRANADEWLYTKSAGLDARVSIGAVASTIALADLYAGIQR
jgi:Uma2 family endonuclease